MSRTSTRRLLVQSSPHFLSEVAPTTRLSLQCLRSFTQSSRRRADEDDSPPAPREHRSFPTPFTNSTPNPPTNRFNYGQKAASPSLNPKAAPGSMFPLAGFADILDQNNKDRTHANKSPWALDNLSQDGNLLSDAEVESANRPPHQLHIFASKHNCHITLWGPPKSVRMNKKKDKESFKGGALFSISAGNIGFRHSGRKHYDSAFQLAVYTFARMAEAGVSQDVEKLELYLRGYGAGREAVTKALLGAEGKLLRNKVVKVADTTKLKFGGSRSPNPRRL